MQIYVSAGRFSLFTLVITWERGRASSFVHIKLDAPAALSLTHIVREIHLRSERRGYKATYELNIRSAIITWSGPMVHADSCSGAASFHLHKHIYIYSSKTNAVAGNLFILWFLVLPHLHREHSSWLLRVGALLGRSWKWHGRDFHAFLDAVNREIYLEYLVVFIKISIFGARYRF